MPQINSSMNTHLYECFHLRWWTQFSSRFEIGKHILSNSRLWEDASIFVNEKFHFCLISRLNVILKKGFDYMKTIQLIKLRYQSYFCNSFYSFKCDPTCLLEMKGTDVDYLRSNQTNFAISKIIKITIVVCKYKNINYK